MLMSSLKIGCFEGTASAAAAATEAKLAGQRCHCQVQSFPGCCVVCIKRKQFNEPTQVAMLYHGKLKRMLNYGEQ